MTYLSDVAHCKNCHGEWDRGSYNEEYFHDLFDHPCPDCGHDRGDGWADMLYLTVSDRYEADGWYWCRECGCYLPGSHPTHVSDSDLVEGLDNAQETSL